VGAWVLVRWQGTPIGAVTVPLIGGGCSAARLSAILQRELGDAVRRAEIETRLSLADGHTSPSGTTTRVPSATVAVCTRDRPEHLARCLESLEHPEYGLS
jgi:hypothetical protein